MLSTVQPNYLRDALPESAPTQGESWQAIMKDLNTLIVPGLTHWESSRKFFAYFKPHSSYPAVLGETLCAGLNVMGFDWIASPACTELEVVTLDWLAKILHLPQCFLSSDSGPGGGVIQGSAGESATVALTAAIERTRSGTGGSAISVNGGHGVTPSPGRSPLSLPTTTTNAPDIERGSSHGPRAGLACHGTAGRGRIVDDRRRVYLDAEADRRLRISPPPAIREAPTMRTDAWNPPRVHIMPIERGGVVIPAGGGDNEVRKGNSLFLLQF